MPPRPREAALFHGLHAGPDVLVLANAWDAQSARVIEQAGARAIATSSAAVAWSHGYGDGHDLPFPRLVETVAEIVRVVNVPVSVDMEGGYADDPGRVGENVRALIEAGGVGINIEDGTSPPDLLARKIASVREVAGRAGVDLFVNARCDVYLRGLREGREAFVETLSRARAYREAGASGLFVPWLVDLETIAEIAQGTPLPVNVMARKGLPPAARLGTAGVRRLSAAAGLSRAAYGAAARAAEAFLAGGDSDALVAAGGTPVDYQAMFLPPAKV
jgi:2-methylisocitrate lyase-like PEP mutase family enzyme